MPVYPIPNDWDDVSWGCVLVDWPDSPQWLGLLRGLVQTPVRGRFWDGSTGSIIDAQNIGLEIQERNPIVTCQDIVTALNLINATLLAMDVNVSQQVTVQTAISNNVELVATAVSASLALQTGDLVAVSISAAQSQANAFAWSQSFAQNNLGIKIINNTQAQFRPIEVGVDPPPQAAEAAPTGITAVAESTTPTEICKRSYWLVRGLKDYLVYLDDLNDNVAATVLGLSGFLSDGFWYAAYKAGPATKRFLVPAAVFLSVTHRLQELLYDGFDPWFDLREWIEDNFNSLVCEIAEGVEAGDSTEVLEQIVTDSLTASGVNPLYHFIPLVVTNFSSLAALYYEAPLLDPAPAVPPYEPADICTFCGE